MSWAEVKYLENNIGNKTTNTQLSEHYDNITKIMDYSTTNATIANAYYIVINDELYCSVYSSPNYYLQKFNDEHKVFDIITTLPITSNSYLVEFNNQIHIFYNFNSTKKTVNHCIYDLNEKIITTTIDTASYFLSSTVVAYNGSLHTFTSSKHCMLVDSTWEEIDDMPISSSPMIALVFKDEIYLYWKGNTSFYKWNETDGFTKLTSIPYAYAYNWAADDDYIKIYGYGSSDYNWSNYQNFKMLKFNGSTWTTDITFSPSFYYGDKTFSIASYGKYNYQFPIIYKEYTIIRSSDISSCLDIVLVNNKYYPQIGFNCSPKYPVLWGYDSDTNNIFIICKGQYSYYDDYYEKLYYSGGYTMYYDLDGKYISVTNAYSTSYSLSSLENYCLSTSNIIYFIYSNYLFQFSPGDSSISTSTGATTTLKTSDLNNVIPYYATIITKTTKGTIVNMYNNTTVISTSYDFSNAYWFQYDEGMMLISPKSAFSQYVFYYHNTSLLEYPSLDYDINLNNIRGVEYNNCAYIFSGNEIYRFTKQEGWEKSSLALPINVTGNNSNSRVFITNDGDILFNVGTTIYKISNFFRTFKIGMFCGSKLVCDKNSLTPITDNIEEYQGGYRCTQDGIMEFKINNIDGLFYALKL